MDVTLFATGDSQTAAKLEFVSKTSYEEDRSLDPRGLGGNAHRSFFEQAENYDLLHNHFDFLPLTYSRLVNTPLLTTIHGFSSEKILPVFGSTVSRLLCLYHNADRPDCLTWLLFIMASI